MKLNKTNSSVHMEPRTLETTAERRRIGRTGHDEQDTGSVERAAVKRDRMRMLDAPLSVQQDEDTFNPYDRRPAGKSKDGRPVKTDLRKLSEWIKTMRAVEEKKARGEE
jgi:hypothetical protein